MVFWRVNRVYGLLLVLTMISLTQIEFATSKLTATPDSVPSEASFLAHGGRYLDQNEPGKAEQAYRQIPWQSSLWASKVHDYIRYYLSPKDQAQHLLPERAWRLTQLLRRVRQTDIAQLGYYEALASYLAGSCPLAYADSGDVFVELLWASTYRYAEKFIQSSLRVGESFSEMADGARVDSYIAGFVPYLSDLKTSKLIKGAGCRAYRASLNSLEAPSYELKHLMAAIERPASGEYTLKNSDLWLLAIRAQTLAKQISKRDTEVYLKAMTARFSDRELVRLPPLERRLAFSDRFEINAENRYRKGQSEAELVLAVLKTATLDEVDWFALLDLDSFNPEERLEILRPWRERDSDRAHPFLILKLAEAEYQLGKIAAALQDLRASACCADPDGESENVDQKESEDFVINLSERIFREYHFNTKVLGALRGVLTPRLWRSLEERLRYDYMVAGDTKSFEHLVKEFRSNDTRLKSVMSALVRRKIGQFTKAWLNISKQNQYLSAEELQFARHLGHAVFTLDSKQRSAIIPFTKLVSETLQAKMAAASPERIEEQQLLIHQLASTGDWQQGNSLVRSGVISVGRVQLGATIHLKNPFQFSVPSKLSKAPLVLMPYGTSYSEWILQ